MKLLAVLIPPYIYHGFSTRKNLWEENFKCEEKFTLGEFTPVNMKNCGGHDVGKHRDIKDSDKYIVLDISLKFVCLYKMRITSSEPKDYLGISGKGLITSLGIKSNIRPNKYKEARYAIGNVIMRYLSKIIREFEHFLYKGYERNRFKHEPTGS